MADFRRNF